MSSLRHKWRWGRSALSLMLLGRVVAFASACGPASGSQGGACKDNGCSTYCDDGLQCDNTNNTCYAPSAPGQGSPTSPALCEVAPLGSGCAGGWVAYVCQPGGFPSPALSGGESAFCDGISSDDAGRTTVCCAVYDGTAPPGPYPDAGDD